MAPEGRLIPLSAVTPVRTRRLWPDRVPLAAIIVLEGDPAQAKSSITYDLAARVTSGWPMPLCDDTAVPAGVVLLQSEDHLAETVRPALEAAGADVGRVLVYDRVNFSNQRLALPGDLPAVEAAVAEVQARLLVIDPLTAFLDGDTNSERAMRRTLARLTEFAERTAS